MTKQKTITVVNAIPINKKGQFLLSQRNSKNSAWNNKWQTTGGTMEFGEKPEQTLARELEEELSVSARILFPYPITSTSVWYKQDTNNDYDQHTNIMAFLVDIGTQKPEINNAELKKFEWFSLEETLALDTLPNVNEVLLEAEKIIKADGSRLEGWDNKV